MLGMRETVGRAFLLTAMVVIAGCGPSRPPMGQVRGSVSYEGKPVASGTIQFWPSEGRPSKGTIKDGAYELTTFEPNDGAYVGEHMVTIKSTKLDSTQPELESTAAEIAHFKQTGVKPIRASRVEWMVPSEYSDVQTTELTATVESGENQIDFHMKEDGND